MIILEIFFALFVIMLVLFGKIEFSSKVFKLYINIAHHTFPLISIVRKKENNDNVSI